MDTFDSYRSSVPARLPGSRHGSLAPRGSSGLPEATSQSPLSIRVALRGARRYWWLVLMLWVVGSAGIGAAVYLKVKPSFKAYSIVRVVPASNDLYGVRTSGETFDPFLQTLVNLVTSPNVLTAAGSERVAATLPRVQAAGDVVQELRKVINVVVIPNTYLIEVSMTSSNSYEAAVLVNAVVDAFIKSNEEFTDGMSKTQIKSLENYLSELKNQTDELELKWKELVAKGDVNSLIGNELAKRKEGRKASEDPTAPSQNSITIDEYKKVRGDLAQVKIDLAQAQAWLESARAAAANKLTSETSLVEDEAQIKQSVERRLRADPEITNLAGKYQAAEAKVNDTKRIARDPNDPARTAAQKKLAAIQKEYWDLKAVKSRVFREEFLQGGPQGHSPDQEIRDAVAQVDQLKIRQATLIDHCQKLELISSQQLTDSVDITLLLDKRESFRTMQEAVNRRLEQLKFEAKGETRITQMNKAVPSSVPFADKSKIYLAMTPVGVLGTVLGLIVLLEIRAGRVGDPDQLSSKVRHEVFSIAPLPNIRPGDDPNDDKAEQRLARFVQSLDHLRVAICEGGAPGAEGRCVMITSATGGEGKTTLSAHLAARCANAGTSTLLIDADMRRASLGRLLDIPVGTGLGDVLAGDAELDEALITVQAGGFHFLSAGTPGRDPSRVLKSTRFSELIGRLRQTYDLVIIDTPPVLPVADALIMGRWVDGAVVAARFDASRMPLVERANRQLALAGIPVLGVVINGVRGQKQAYNDYAYGYGYGYGYGYNSRTSSSTDGPSS
jgi:polysaccharide biosynthesis transport protein